MRVIARALRTSAFGIALIVGMIWLVASSPLNLLNPLMRALGVRGKHFPSNISLRTVTRVVLWSGGIDVQITPESSPEALRLLAEGPCIAMYTHASNLDPLIVLSLCANVPKFIYKRELGFVPLVGWCLFLYQHVSINRKNREDAIRSLDVAVTAVVAKAESVAIAPEGTRSRTGELGDFKRGPFHMAVQSGAPIVPIVIRGAYETLPPKTKMFHLHTVKVTLLPPFRGKCVDEAQAATEAAVKSCVAKAKLEEEGPSSSKVGGRARSMRRPSAVAEVIGALPAIVIHVAAYAAYWCWRRGALLVQ